LSRKRVPIPPFVDAILKARYLASSLQACPHQEAPA
jgi:hypothetical protein